MTPINALLPLPQYFGQNLGSFFANDARGRASLWFEALERVGLLRGEQGLGDGITLPMGYPHPLSNTDRGFDG